MAAPKARMTPPIDGRHNSIRTPRGTNYSCAVGSSIDVPTFDAHVLSANGWKRLGGPTAFVGATTDRPIASAGQPLASEQVFIDTTLGIVVTWVPAVNGVAGTWVNVLTGAPA